MLSADMRELGKDFKVLGNRSFRRLFLARSVSLFGNAMAPVALAFTVLALPGRSGMDLGLVLAVYSAARLLFLPLGGILSDRWRRSRVMVGSDLLAFLSQGVVATLFLTHTASLVPLMALSAVNGATSAVFLPASKGAIPQVVSGDQLQSANALLRLAGNTAMIIGAALAGVLVTFAGGGSVKITV